MSKIMCNGIINLNVIVNVNKNIKQIDRNNLYLTTKTFT